MPLLVMGGVAFLFFSWIVKSIFKTVRKNNAKQRKQLKQQENGAKKTT